MAHGDSEPARKETPVPVKTNGTDGRDGRGRGRGKGKGAALLASALCALYVGALAAPATSTAAVPQATQALQAAPAPAAAASAAATQALLAEPELRVVSWNICGEAGGVRGEDGFCAYRNEPQRKVDQIAQVAAEHDANVIMLQEVCGEAPGSHMERLRAALGAGWSIEHAKGGRPTDGATYCRGGLSGELGVGIAVKGRVSEVTAVNTVPAGGDLQTLPVLCVRVEGWSTRVCTTHILADGADPRRSGQIQNVKSEIWPDRNQLVLGGDFNMFPGSAQLQPISEAFDECDARSYGGGDEVNEATHHSWSEQGGHQLRKRDHIFASWSESGSPFTACDVDPSRMDTTENRPSSGPPDGYSDHAPIIGNLRPVKHAEATGDFNGDGRADLAVLSGLGKSADGRNQSSLWTFYGTATGFSAPRRVWDSGTDSWNWSASALTAGDFDGDGKADLGVLYNYGRTGDRNRTGLWTFTANGSGFASPRQVWDSGTGSWNWAASKPVAGDFDGDGKADIGVLYDYGRTGDRGRSGLWTFSANGSGFGAPRKVWDSAGTSDDWKWAVSSPAAGDFNGDGRADIGVLYDNGNASNGLNRTDLRAFTSRGAEFGAPQRYWDSSLPG